MLNRAPAGLSLAEALALVGEPEVEVEVTTPLAFFTVVVTVPSALVVTVVVLALLLLPPPPPPPPPAALAPEVPLVLAVALAEAVAPAALVEDAADVDALVVVGRVVATLLMAPILLTLDPRPPDE